MMVLVDTPVWSLALRRKAKDLNPREHAVMHALTELIREGRAQLMGVIRQELLSGIGDEHQFERLRDYLRAFSEPRLEARDYEQAAQMHTACRGRGVAGSTIDFLICAVADRRNWQILTTDRDFDRYRKILGLDLYPA